MPLLEVANLQKLFPLTSGFLRHGAGFIRAVDGVSFSLDPGETLALVGESGCGKTTTGRLILRLIERTAGDIKFHLDEREVDLGNLGGEELRRFRRHVQLVFQDPYSSLNPRLSIYETLAEPLRAQDFGTKREIEDRLKWLIHAVGMPISCLGHYPHAFSGGQRQRICIARALALSPNLVVCDEPVSALDVSVQAQILNLLKDLQEQSGLSYLFIAHDLAVVENISDRIAVMYAGKIVEMAPASSLFTRPLHPYTQALMDAVPTPLPRGRSARLIPPSDPADPGRLPSGCAFNPRCRFANDQCRREIPSLIPVKENRHAACHMAGELELAGLP